MPGGAGRDRGFAEQHLCLTETGTREKMRNNKFDYIWEKVRLSFFITEHLSMKEETLLETRSGLIRRVQTELYLH